MASSKYAFAIRFISPETSDDISNKTDVIGNYVTNDPKKIREIYNNLVDIIYPSQANDERWYDDFMDTFDVEPTENVKPFLGIIKVYLDDVGLKKSTPMKDSDKSGNFPDTVYFVHGSSDDVWTVLTDSFKKADDYVKTIFDEDGTHLEVKLDTVPSQDEFFTYSGY